MPYQAVGTMVVQIGLLALAAALLGTGAGVPLAGWLIDLQGGSSGIGAGIAQAPSWGVLSLLACVPPVVAAAACVLPATRATVARGPRGMTNAL
jgi:putative ABC transport system permease protein